MGRLQILSSFREASKSLENPCKNAMPDLQIRESSRKGDNRRRTLFTSNTGNFWIKQD